MEDSREIRPLGSAGFRLPLTPAGGHSSVQRKTERREDPRDRIDVTAPERELLALLRERVLDRTRAELKLASQRAIPAFAEDPNGGVEGFVSRLVSSQNLLAAERRGSWSSERIDAALHAATRDGVAEAIDILMDLERMDEGAWELVAAVTVELQRKIAVSIDVARPS